MPSLFFVSRSLTVPDSNWVSVSPQACIVAVILLLVIPFPWLAGWIFAAFIHEICHYIAVLLCRGKVTAIRLNAVGAVLETGYLSLWESVICSLAGPAGGLILCLLSGKFPRLAVCGFLQSVYNLLPVYPLDGGRAVRAICTGCFQKATADKICTGLEMIVLSGILIISIVSAFFLKFGILPIFAGTILLLRLVKIKIPCKSGLHAVQ